MTIVRRPWSFDELTSLPKAVDRLLDESLLMPRRWLRFPAEVPALDLRSTPDAFLVEAALPGVKPEEVEITVDADILTIKGSFKEETKGEREGYLFEELQRGEFSRSVTLPGAIRPDEAKATFKDGLLTLMLPKAEAARPHTVKIQAS